MVEAPRPTRREYVPPRVTVPSPKRLAPEGGFSGTILKPIIGTYSGPS